MRGLKRKSDSSVKGIQSIYIHVHCLQNAFPIKYSTNKNENLYESEEEGQRNNNINKQNINL